MMDTVLDLLFPRRSLGGRAGAFVTREELALLTPLPVRLESSVLSTMGLSSLDRVVAAGSYARSPLLRRAMYTWKYGRIPGMGKELGKVLVNSTPLLGSHFTDSDGICPVPLHWSREFYRGFNQAYQLATMLSGITGVPLMCLLTRVRATGFQARRRGRVRAQSMCGAFRSAEITVFPWRVILVDDIMTTGATMNACAQVLKARGVKWVGGLVLAKG